MKNVINDKNFLGIFSKEVNKNLDIYSKNELEWLLWAGYKNIQNIEKISSEDSDDETLSVKYRNTAKLYIRLYEEYYEW